jgi:N-acetylmuramoyl-L-alanine amidase
MIAALVAVALTLGLWVSTAAPAAAVGAPSLKPDIVKKSIPYGPRRKDQMAAYSKRHYGKRAWELVAPPVIVQHYTAGLSFEGAWNHFASNSKWNGEYPGTCSHFIIDRDGTIYQLVPLGTRCRHVVGMNHVSVGIEHVGTSDGMVLGDPQQMRSSLRLTVWLMRKFDVNIGDVIGHAEALEHRLHIELYKSWRCLVHADFPHKAMRKYRSRLRDVAQARGVPLGDGVDWRPSGC